MHKNFEEQGNERIRSSPSRSPKAPLQAPRGRIEEEEEKVVPLKQSREQSCSKLGSETVEKPNPIKMINSKMKKNSSVFLFTLTI